MIPRAVDDING